MEMQPTRDSVKSFLFVVGGWICVGFAVIGAVLPLLPTTPFLLLASWCFYRGSPRIHAWLHRSRWFGPTLDDWHEYRGIRRTVKYRTLGLVAAVVISSLLLNSLPVWLKYVAIGAVCIGVYVIATVPTLPDDTPRPPRTILTE